MEFSNSVIFNVKCYYLWSWTSWYCWFCRQ